MADQRQGASGRDEGSLGLAAAAWIEIAHCRARLRLPRFLDAEHFLRQELLREPLESQPSESLDRLLVAFRRALSAQPGALGCLPRSLAMRRFLARHGHDSRLGLGLRRTSGRIAGHAWVEARGEILSGDAPFVRSFARLQVARNDGPDGGFRRVDG